MKKSLAVLAVYALACSCANAGLKSEINVAMNAEPETYDLAKTTATVAFQMVQGNVYEKLVNTDDKLNVHMELAESYEANEDFTQYTYKLRKGVKFHNGEEMKADDVVASMNRWLKGGTIRMATGESLFEKIDDYTVTIKFKEPVMMFNMLLGANIKPGPIIVPKSIIDAADEKTGMITEYIGTGPYMIDEIAAHSHLRIKKFDDYVPYGVKGEACGWVGYKEALTPYVTFHFVSDSSTRIAGVQFGEYDLSIQLPFDVYEQFDGNDEFLVYKEAQGEIGMVYNKRKGISTNKYFRQAVNAALSRLDIMQAAYVRPDFYDLTPSFIEDTNNFWYTETGADVYNVSDAAKTKELLAKAGYNGEPFRLVVSSHYVEFYNATIVVERQLKDAGINVDLQVVDWPTYLTTAKKPEAYDAFITGFSQWAVPGQILYLTQTWNGWSDDAHLGELMASVAHATDPALAKQFWEEAQSYCWNDYMPVSKLGNRYIYDVASENMKGLIFYEGPHMWNVVVEE